MVYGSTIAQSGGSASSSVSLKTDFKPVTKQKNFGDCLQKERLKRSPVGKKQGVLKKKVLSSSPEGRKKSFGAEKAKDETQKDFSVSKKMEEKVKNNSIEKSLKKDSEPLKNEKEKIESFLEEAGFEEKEIVQIIETVFNKEDGFALKTLEGFLQNFEVAYENGNVNQALESVKKALETLETLVEKVPLQSDSQKQMILLTQKLVDTFGKSEIQGETKETSEKKNAFELILGEKLKGGELRQEDVQNVKVVESNSQKEHFKSLVSENDSKGQEEKMPQKDSGKTGIEVKATPLNGQENSSKAVSESEQLFLKTSFEKTPSRIGLQQLNMTGRVKMAQNIMNQVIQGTKTQVSNMQAAQEITLRLKPAELGQVDLKLSVEKGILMAEFQVENQMVKETLESNMADLKHALQEKGYGVEGMQVSVGKDQSENSPKQFFGENTKRRYFFSEDENQVDFQTINKTLLSLQSTFEYLG